MNLRQRPLHLERVGVAGREIRRKKRTITKVENFESHGNSTRGLSSQPAGVLAQLVKRRNVTKPTLEEFRRRLAEASPEIVSFREKDQYGKRTNRIHLPKAFFALFHDLSQLGRVTIGFDGQLLLVPSEVWNEYLQEACETLAKVGCEHSVDELIRNSEPAPIDGKGRITLSLLSVKEARLQDEVLICPGRTIEIWDPGVHHDYREKVVLALKAKLGIPTNCQQPHSQT